MDYTIEISFHQHYIHAITKGTNSSQSVNGYLNDIRTAIEHYKCKNILIEDGLIGKGIDTIDVFEIIRNHGRYAKSNNLRIAYIDRDKGHQRSTVSFGENLANMMGVNVKVFSAVEKAAEWLSLHTS